MDEIDELEELSLYTEIIDLASRSVVANDLGEVYDHNVCDEELDEVINYEEMDEDDDAVTDIIQCIMNLIELEDILEMGSTSSKSNAA